MKYLISLGFLLLSVFFLQANPPARVRAVQAQQFIATTFQPFQIQVPTYGAAYNGAVSDESIRALTAAIEKLNVNLLNLHKLETLPPPKTTKIEAFRFNAQAVFGQRCASCHEKQVAAEKGNKFVLMDRGAILPIPKEKEGLLMMHIYRGTMPKDGKKLNDVEVADVIEYLYHVRKLEAKE